MLFLMKYTSGAEESKSRCIYVYDQSNNLSSHTIYNRNIFNITLYSTKLHGIANCASPIYIKFEIYSRNFAIAERFLQNQKEKATDNNDVFPSCYILFITAKMQRSNISSLPLSLSILRRADNYYIRPRRTQRKRATSDDDFYAFLTAL